MTPPGPPGVSREAILSSEFKFGGLGLLKFGPKPRKLKKTSEMTRKTSKIMFFDTFSKFLSFEPNFSALNFQIQTQWIILLL